MNALSRDMLGAFRRVAGGGGGSREIGCVVVRGAGDRAFCAGGDVKSMAAGARDQDKTHEDKVHDIRSRMRVSELLHEMGKPTIAMVNAWRQARVCRSRSPPTCASPARTRA